MSGIRLDLSTSFPHERSSAHRRSLARPAAWLEPRYHPLSQIIALLRRDAPLPIASGATLLERRDSGPISRPTPFDTEIVDVIWNGFNESLNIAALADVL